MTTSDVIAVVALAVSLLTAWLTLFRRGTVRMTRPATIYFGADGGPIRDERSGQKVYLRALLYATSARGRIVETMFVRLRRGETSQNFNVWVSGDKSLERGSGMFIGQNGVATNHHFILPADGTRFEFLEGRYELELYATLVGEPSSIRLFTEQLVLTGPLAAGLKEPRCGVYFDWGADTKSYHAHVRKQQELDFGKLLSELAG